VTHQFIQAHFLCPAGPKTRQDLFVPSVNWSGTCQYTRWEGTSFLKKLPSSLISANERPTMTLNSPGSTMGCMLMKDNSSGVSLNLTVFFSPGSSQIFSNPLSWMYGVTTELITSLITTAPHRPSFPGIMMLPNQFLQSIALRGNKNP
jgi:hypothetical protein